MCLPRVGISTVRLRHRRCLRWPVEKHGVTGHLRQKGKIAEPRARLWTDLSVALKAMGALDMGLMRTNSLSWLMGGDKPIPHIVKLLVGCGQSRYGGGSV
jgi:hypothetical protein